MKIFKLFVLQLIRFLFFIIFMIAINSLYIHWSKSDVIFSSVYDVRAYKHVLIPGAGNSPLGESQNPSFSSRMNTGVKLFFDNHVTRIVCSGISGIPYYNEPHDMKEFLISKKVPAEIIIEDHGAENTMATIKSYAKKFPRDSVVIVSQRAHLERALFIADHYDLVAVGLIADLKPEKFDFEDWFYEVLAKVKCIWQLMWD